MKLKFYLILLSIFLSSCTQNIVKIKNEKAGKLVATHYLKQSGIKKIPIDEETPPQSPYMQMLEDASGNRILTVFNEYQYAINIYDYDREIQIGKIKYEKEGPNGIIRLTGGYYFINMDSIYVYNSNMPEVVLTDSTGKVKQRISLLIDEREDWPYYFPQYSFKTVNPILKSETN